MNKKEIQDLLNKSKSIHPHSPTPPSWNANLPKGGDQVDFTIKGGQNGKAEELKTKVKPWWK